MNRKCLQGWLGNLRNGYIVRILRPVTISGDIRLGIPYRFERSSACCEKFDRAACFYRQNASKRASEKSEVLILKIVGHEENYEIEKNFSYDKFFFFKYF